MIWYDAKGKVIHVNPLTKAELSTYCGRRAMTYIATDDTGQWIMNAIALSPSSEESEIGYHPLHPLTKKEYWERSFPAQSTQGEAVTASQPEGTPTPDPIVEMSSQQARQETENIQPPSEQCDQEAIPEVSVPDDVSSEKRHSAANRDLLAELPFLDDDLDDSPIVHHLTPEEEDLLLKTPPPRSDESTRNIANTQLSVRLSRISLPDSVASTTATITPASSELSLEETRRHAAALNRVLDWALMPPPKPPT